MKYGIQTDKDMLGEPEYPSVYLVLLVVLFSLWTICSNWQDGRREPYQTLEVSK